MDDENGEISLACRKWVESEGDDKDGTDEMTPEVSSKDRKM